MKKYITPKMNVRFFEYCAILTGSAEDTQDYVSALNDENIQKAQVTYGKMEAITKFTF